MPQLNTKSYLLEGNVKHVKEIQLKYRIDRLKENKIKNKTKTANVKLIYLKPFVSSVQRVIGPHNKYKIDPQVVYHLQVDDG